MRIQIPLPVLHLGQQELHSKRKQLNVVRCGRRWGKTKMLEALSSSAACRGEKVGIFTPEYRQMQEPMESLIRMLYDGIAQKSKTDKVIRLLNNGQIDFWTTNDNELAGRGREYDLVLVDEAAFTKSPQMLNEIWEKSIKPTMLTTRGSAWVFSTPKGVDPENFFYALCHDSKWGFHEFHAPTSTNPYVPPDSLEHERLINDPLVFKQEYLAEFVDWSGVAFFPIERMLVDGKAVPYPTKTDGVFAVIDTAVKGGKSNDGTAVMYCSLNLYDDRQPPLVILDWDILQIDGALLETWLPTVFQRLEELAGKTNARRGSVGAFIEDAAAGSILIQQAKIRGWPAQAIDSALTAKGKDERAISVSGHYFQEKIKISDYAMDKVVGFKGASRNHLLTQISGFKIGDKEASVRADDLLDCFTYSIAIGVGNKYGY